MDDVESYVKDFLIVLSKDELGGAAVEGLYLRLVVTLSIE